MFWFKGKVHCIDKPTVNVYFENASHQQTSDICKPYAPLCVYYVTYYIHALVKPKQVLLLRAQCVFKANAFTCIPPT